jgi:hypothetical protein
MASAGAISFKSLTGADAGRTKTGKREERGPGPVPWPGLTLFFLRGLRRRQVDGSLVLCIHEYLSKDISKRLLAGVKYLPIMSTRLETDLGWGPDYGPFSYTLLPEPHLESELRRLSGLDTLCEGVDVVSFQPCPDPTVRNEDRWAAEVWDMPGGRWTFLGVFDGTESCARTGFKH